MLPSVMINGLYSSGRHYLVALLEAVLRCDPRFEILDGLGHTARPGLIQHNHALLGAWPFHYSWEVFKPHVEDMTGTKLVLLCRDPRDMLVSSFRFTLDYRTEAAHKLLTLGSKKDALLAFMRSGDQYGFLPLSDFCKEARFYFDHPRFYVVRYEDLSRQLVPTIKNLLLHLEIPFEDSRLTSLATSTVRTGLSGQWAYFFDDEVEAAFKEMTGDWVESWGYELDASWSSRVQSGSEGGNRAGDMDSWLPFVSEEAVVWCYRLVLGRNPESRVILEQQQQAMQSMTVQEALLLFLEGPEFRQGVYFSKLRQIINS